MTLRTRYTSLVAVAAVTAAMLGTPSKADAAFKIRVSEDAGKTWTEVEDNKGGDLASAQAGAINMMYSGSSVSFSVVVGQSKPLFGNTSGYSVMDLSISGSFSKAGNVIVDITDTDWNAPANFAGPGLLAVTLGNNNTAGLTSHTGIGYLNSDDPGIAGAQGNKEYGGIESTTGLVFDTGLASGTTGNPSASNHLPGVTGPYSLSMRTTFGASGAAGFSIDDKITFTPAPASLLLAAVGLPMLGIGAQLRRRKAAPTAV